MNKTIVAGLAMLALMTSCNMENENPLLSESPLPYGAPQFDKIRTEHYVPAFEKAIESGKAEIDAIIANQEEPTFENTIEALEYAGEAYNNVASIFYNVLEADSNDELQNIAEQLAPMENEYSMYIALNEGLFNRVKAVYGKKDELGLAPEQMKLLVDTYKSFSRNGANLSPEDKATYSALNEKLSLATLKFGKNVLAATNAYSLNLTDEAELEGLPDYVIALGKETAVEKGQEGWTFDLSAPSYAPFMKFSARRDLRKKLYEAYNTRAVGGDSDNTEVVKEITGLRLQIANILGYPTYADYALEERMLKTPSQVDAFLQELMGPSLPKAREEIKAIYEYATANGFDDTAIQSWDFSYWSEKYKNEQYTLSESDLKPYFQLENCIDAIFGLAGRLYGLRFEERPDIPAYHKDVKVYDVTDENGRHMALFYADFFPRASKRTGAWMTEFRGQSIRDGVERRPFISIVTNLSKPTAGEPSLLTHDELETFLHEFGHALHGMLAESKYPSQAGTNVSRDFVELPSQIMENFAYEQEYLAGFAKHYKTGETIPQELVDKVIAARNYNSAYLQVRQLHFGILDMAWHECASIPSASTIDYENASLAPYAVFPQVEGTSISTSITHLFSGGYAAGYYSYKWAEVLEADAFSLFKEKGIFNTEVSHSFRDNILARGSEDDEAVLYRNFRGHDPQPSALLEKLGIVEKR
ncbi:MAG: M3 family metallopeptidase [Bacteroidales bacterium]|nr:M3 family metallopeptidase [Bacteroidales bacterium]